MNLRVRKGSTRIRLATACLPNLIGSSIVKIRFHSVDTCRISLTYNHRSPSQVSSSCGPLKWRTRLCWIVVFGKESRFSSEGRSLIVPHIDLRQQHVHQTSQHNLLGIANISRLIIIMILFCRQTHSSLR